MEVCKRCGKVVVKCQSLSRRDNKTKICGVCGTDEALIDFAIAESLKRKLITHDEAETIRLRDSLWLKGNGNFIEPIFEIEEEL